MAERLFQVGIKGLVQNEKGEILLVQIPAWPEKNRPSYWDLPGGRMDEGETFYQTLARELSEEIDCEYVGEPELVSVVISNITVPLDDGTEAGLILMPYRVTLAPGSVITLNDHETDFGWFDLEAAAKELAHKYPPEFTAAVKTLK